MSIALDNPLERQAINIDTSQDQPMVTPDVAAKRAAHASFGLTNTPFDYDTIHEAIMSGQEKQMRQKVASNIDKTATQSFIDNLPGDPGQALANIQQMKPTDPNSVFEYTFSKQYMNTLYNNVKPND